MENEKRLIYANVAIEKCNKLLDNSHSCSYPAALSGVELVRDLILSECETGCPTVDAVEVVYGRWIPDQVESCNPWVPSLPILEDVMQCSVCQEYIEGSYGTPYCPNCGAKMYGGNKDG